MTPRRRRAAVAHHYDLPSEFYALFLDPLMVYTCAHYRRPDGDLAEAQQDKLDLVCRKLRLAAGETLLDLGCGWGGLAVWAAERYGVRVHALTLSRAQAAYARAWVARAGLASRVDVEERDCLDPTLGGSYDKVAGVGITEHLGVAAQDRYFATVRRLLRPGGLFLHHGITQPPGWRHTSQWDFLIAHVFPGGELTDLGRTTAAIEAARLEVVDVEGLRAHYARTTRQWAERLGASMGRAARLVGARTARTWLLYLAAASVAFEAGWIGLHQVVTVRADAATPAVPSTRERLYAPDDTRDGGRVRRHEAG
jgi:cyclopropane-fatty-acyl-phospholipid synthase